MTILDGIKLGTGILIVNIAANFVFKLLTLVVLYVLAR